MFIWHSTSLELVGMVQEMLVNVQKNLPIVLIKVNTEYKLPFSLSNCFIWRAGCLQKKLLWVFSFTSQARLDLGTDRFGFGYGGTGKKSNAKQFDDYGGAYGKNDVIGMLIYTFPAILSKGC